MRRLDFINDALAGLARLRPDDDLTSLNVTLKLVWSGRLAEELLHQVATAGGLRRRGDYEVLALLRRFEPELLTPVEVANQLLTSASGMTGKLDRLQERGLLERKPDDYDRRLVKLELTDEGRSMVDRIFATNLSIHQATLEELSSVDKDSLDELLSRVLARLEELSGMREPWRKGPKTSAV